MTPNRNQNPRFLEKKKITLPIFTGATPATLHDFQLGEIVPPPSSSIATAQPFFASWAKPPKKTFPPAVDWLLSTRTSKSPKPLLKNF